MRKLFLYFPGHGVLLFAGMLGLVLGTALQLQQAQLFAWPVYLVFVLLAPVTYWFVATKSIVNGPHGVRAWQWWLAVLALGLLGYGATGLRADVYERSALAPALEGRDVRVSGVVARLVQRNELGVHFTLQVESALLDGQPVQVPPRVNVGWYADRAPLPDVRPGERWQMTLRLKAPHGTRNPHGFDYELYLWEQGVQATGYVRTSVKDLAPQRITQTWRYPVALARQVVRERIFRQVEERAFAGTIAALVVGDQSAIERLDWDVFRATGVAHLVSISGLHISMFAWGAALWVGWLWRRSGRLCDALPAPSAALVGGVLLATAYAVFAGWGVPAQRTCLMLATVALLRLSNARWPWPMVWMLACAVVVASDPWALLQPGFWLSFVAVGILFATDIGATKADSTGARGIKVHMLSGLKEQWVITVALTPLTLLLFGQVSLVGLLANALAIPWITLVVTPLAMLGVAVPVLWDVAAAAIGGLYLYLQWLAGWSWASISVAVPPLWAGVAGVVGGVLLVLPWGWRLRVLGLPLLLAVVLWRVPLPAVGHFELLAVDVGQGDAVLVRTATHALLFDAGPRYSLESDAGHRVLVPLLQALHTRLDTLVLSHRDMDHVGGAPAVLAMQPQAALLSSIEASHPLQGLRSAKRCEAGQHWEWDGVRFDVLHPQAADYDTPAKSNAMSCVLRISNGRQTALLAGDIEQAQEARLVAQGVDLSADLLLVPHHGSKTSSSGEFLDAVAPSIAIVQSGYRNRFGHPAPGVLARLQERQIAVVDSPHCGAFTWQPWQAQNGACLRTEGLRYWHHRVP